jgi:predicted transposase YbfD/YdcC
VAALTHGSELVVGQVQVAAKTNEIPAARDLLALFDLDGVVVTLDAMHTQAETAEFVTGEGGDYVLTVKGNQCATRRSEVSPPQAGQTRREVS